MKEVVIVSLILILTLAFAFSLFSPGRTDVAYQICMQDLKGNKYYGYEKGNVVYARGPDNKNYIFEDLKNGRVRKIDPDGRARDYGLTVVDE